MPVRGIRDGKKGQRLRGAKKSTPYLTRGGEEVFTLRTEGLPCSLGLDGPKRATTGS